MLLPHTEYHLRNAETYMWIWFASMQPRFVSSVHRLYTYFRESVIDPELVPNVKQFQFVKIVLYILLFSYWIGCVYYFMARLMNFNETTWIHSFETELPNYKYNIAGQGGEFVLLLYKGFCRVAALGYDPGLPGNAIEMVWTALVYFCSIFISSMILGNILTYLVRLSPIEVAHKERIKALRVYMEKKQLPADLHDSVIRYCQFQYNKQKQSEAISGHDLFKALSRSLRIEVANAYHSDVIQRCSQIGRPFHRCSQAFFDELVTKLYTVHVMPGDHIVHKDEIPRMLQLEYSNLQDLYDMLSNLSTHY